MICRTDARGKVRVNKASDRFHAKRVINVQFSIALNGPDVDRLCEACNVESGVLDSAVHGLAVLAAIAALREAGGTDFIVG